MQGPLAVLNQDVAGDDVSVAVKARVADLRGAYSRSLQVGQCCIHCNTNVVSGNVLVQHCNGPLHVACSRKARKLFIQRLRGFRLRDKPSWTRRRGSRNRRTPLSAGRSRSPFLPRTLILRSPWLELKADPWLYCGPLFWRPIAAFWLDKGELCLFLCFLPLVCALGLIIALILVRPV